MLTAWRERDPKIRISSAEEALSWNPHCVPALILLAEEKAKTIQKAESLFRLALKLAEQAYNKSNDLKQSGVENVVDYQRNLHTYIYIQRRLAMCWRKMGLLKKSVKMMRELLRKFPTMNIFNIHENLIEALLEMQSYADVQMVLSKYDGELLELSIINLQSDSSLCFHRNQHAQVCHHLLHHGSSQGAKHCR